VTLVTRALLAAALIGGLTAGCAGSAPPPPLGPSSPVESPPPPAATLLRIAQGADEALRSYAFVGVVRIDVTHSRKTLLVSGYAVRGQGISYRVVTPHATDEVVIVRRGTFVRRVPGRWRERRAVPRPPEADLFGLVAAVHDPMLVGAQPVGDVVAFHLRGVLPVAARAVQALLFLQPTTKQLPVDLLVDRQGHVLLVQFTAVGGAGSETVHLEFSRFDQVPALRAPG
jgi:hypothetical protein